MIGPRRSLRARAVRGGVPVHAGVLHRGGACARGGSPIDAQLLPCLSAAVTAGEGKSSTTSSGRSLATVAWGGQLEGCPFAQRERHVCFCLWEGS